MSSASAEPSPGIPPGSTLHLDAVDEATQAEVVRQVDEWLEQGRRGELHGKTFAPVPPNFKRFQQSREMLQFGAYTHSNRVELRAAVLPLPPLLCRVLSECLRRGLLPSDEPSHHASADSGAGEWTGSSRGGGAGSTAVGPGDTSTETDDNGNADGDLGDDASCAPGDLASRGWCCTVNNYETGQWIPAHVDNHKFARPFATLSLLSEQVIDFASPNGRAGQCCGHGGGDDEHGGCSGGRDEAAAAAGGSNWRVSLPVGSLLVLDGQSADELSHAVPPVTARRISLAFRRLTRDALREREQASAGRSEAQKLRARACGKQDRNVTNNADEQVAAPS